MFHCKSGSSLVLSELMSVSWKPLDALSISSPEISSLPNNSTLVIGYDAILLFPVRLGFHILKSSLCACF